MDESDGDKLRPSFINRNVDGERKVFMISLFLCLMFSSSLMASGLGGYAGAASRFTSDPLAAGTGGITLFYNTSTNSYSQNPSSTAFLGERSFDAGLVQLSLDRYIYSVSASTPLPPTATLAFGVIAAGTNNIEGRDSRGYATGELTDNEMTYLVSFSNKFSEKLAFGLSFKLLTRHFGLGSDDLDLKGSGFGAGIGITYKPLAGSTFSLAIKDWNSSYKWKTEDIYELGSSYQDVFPMSLAWGWLQELGSFRIALEHDYYFIEESIFRGSVQWQSHYNLLLNFGASFEDEILYPGFSARYELSWRGGPPMHLDLGMRIGAPGEGMRNYLGWGVNF